MKTPYSLLGILFAISSWKLLTVFELIDPFLLPGPLETISAAVSLFLHQGLLIDLSATFYRVLTAFFLAILIGIPIGLMLGVVKPFYRAVEVLIDFFRSTPATAMFPLFMVIFGVSDSSKIAVTCFAASIIIIFHTAYGVFQAPQKRIIAARLMGAKGYKLFSTVIVWESLPHTFIGLRNAVSLSLVIIIVTEMFIGTQQGIGRRIVDFQITYEISSMYAVILVVGLMGYIMNRGFVVVEERLLHWNK